MFQNRNIYLIKISIPASYLEDETVFSLFTFCLAVTLEDQGNYRLVYGWLLLHYRHIRRSLYWIEYQAAHFLPFLLRT